MYYSLGVDSNKANALCKTGENILLQKNYYFNYFLLLPKII